MKTAQSLTLGLGTGIRKEGLTFYLKIICLLTTAFLVRPSAFGNEYTNYGLAMIFVAIAFHIMDCIYRGIKLTISKNNFAVVSMVLVFFSYIAIQSMLIPNHMNLGSIYKTYIANVLIILVSAMILTDDFAKKKFFKWFTWVILITTISSIITLVLTLFIPMEKLYLFKLQFGGNEAMAGSTYFPFTIIYGVLHYDHIELPRLLGLFRESGIAQMFMLWALFNLKSIDMNKVWVKIVLIIGVILTFSTAGIAVLCVNIVVQQLINLKLLRSIMLLIISYCIIMYVPFIGLHDKVDTGHGKSVSDRQEATFNAWDTLSEHPFGIGFNNSTVFNSGINLMAASNMIGVIGFFLCLFVYFFPAITAGNRKRYILSMLPIVLTSLTSQPLIDAPLVYIMLLAPYICHKDVVLQEAVKSEHLIKEGKVKISYV